jgi:molecular chaperone DnaK
MDYSPVVIPNSEGKRTTPSAVSIVNKDLFMIGDPAMRQAITSPKNTVYSLVPFLGETYEQVEKEISRVPYNVINQNGYPYIDIEGHSYSPQEICAKMLQKMKNTAEAYLKQEVTDAVIAVPACFSISQRQAVKEAGRIAGINVRRMINGSVAAALAYVFNKTDKDMKIAVFNLGGGTFDVTIVDQGGGVFDVLSSCGDTHLGGDDFSQVIIDWLVSEFRNDVGVDLKCNPVAMQRLKDAAEKAKIELSSSSSAEINLPFIMSVNGVSKHLVKTLSRAKFEKLTHNLVQTCLVSCQNAVRNADISVSEISEVILTGCSSRIPAVQTMVKNFFGKKPKIVNPDEIVSMGAAIQGAIYNQNTGQDIILLDITPLTLGIETYGGVMTTIIKANTTIPCIATETFSTAEDNQTEVTIHVLQGEHPMAAQNKSLGQFNLTGIVPAPKGVPQIEVTFHIDVNGLLKVCARDKATGKEVYIHM